MSDDPDPEGDYLIEYTKTDNDNSASDLAEAPAKYTSKALPKNWYDDDIYPVTNDSNIK